MRRLGFCLAGLLVAASTGALSAADLRGTRPNIILVMTDDQGYGDLACHGNPILRTRNLDRHHAESVRFTDFQVSPTCAPTRASLLTGRHEFRNGVTHTILERERLTLKAVTLAQVLKRAGYTTGIFGKWHLGDEEAYRPNRRGFDEVFIHGAGGIGQTYPGSCGDAPNNSYFNPAILHNGRFVRTKGYCTDVFFNQALEWVGRVRRGGAPFFAYITPNAPHAPLDVPEEYERRYAGKVPANVAKFYGMIENIDDNFGRLSRQLDRWGLDRRTLLIFMTDNGGTAGVRTYNAGMRAGKGTPYRGGTRVPALWRWRGKLPKGLDVPHLTAHVDVLPTLAELAGAPLPAGVSLDGRSLVPLLASAVAGWPDRTLFTHVGRWDRGKAAESRYSLCSVRTARYHLVNPLRDRVKWELYDVRDDPGETRDLAAERPHVVERLRRQLDGWWGEVLPDLVNENLTGPRLNPFKELYWKQFGGGPDPDMLRQMDPARFPRY